MAAMIGMLTLVSKWKKKKKKQKRYNKCWPAFSLDRFKLLTSLLSWQIQTATATMAEYTWQRTWACVHIYVYYICVCVHQDGCSVSWHRCWQTYKVDTVQTEEAGSNLCKKKKRLILSRGYLLPWLFPYLPPSIQQVKGATCLTHQAIIKTQQSSPKKSSNSNSKEINISLSWQLLFQTD